MLRCPIERAIFYPEVNGEYKTQYTHCFFFFVGFSLTFLGQWRFLQTQRAVGVALFQAVCGVFLP